MIEELLQQFSCGFIVHFEHCDTFLERSGGEKEIEEVGRKGGRGEGGEEEEWEIDQEDWDFVKNDFVKKEEEQKEEGEGRGWGEGDEGEEEKERERERKQQQEQEQERERDREREKQAEERLFDPPLPPPLPMSSSHIIPLTIHHSLYTITSSPLPSPLTTNTFFSLSFTISRSPLLPFTNCKKTSQNMITPTTPSENEDVNRMITSEVKIDQEEGVSFRKLPTEPPLSEVTMTVQGKGVWVVSGMVKQRVQFVPKRGKRKGEEEMGGEEKKEDLLYPVVEGVVRVEVMCLEEGWWELPGVEVEGVPEGYVNDRVRGKRVRVVGKGGGGGEWI